MKRADLLRCGLVALAVAAFAMSGCSNNNTSSTASGNGTLAVYPLPITVAFPWHLDGPNGYSHDGAGDEILDDMPPGSYTLTWQGVNGWVSPDPVTVTKNVNAGGVTSFTGTYAEQGVAAEGEVSVQPQPIIDGVDFPWTITGPNEFSDSRTGGFLYTNMPTGDYTVTWGDVDGWVTPTPADTTQTLAEGAGITFVGTYTQANVSAIEMKPIPAGSFLMGSPRTEAGASDYEWPQHPVTLTRPFEMSGTEITWDQYENVMDENPSYYATICPTCTPDYPVESVSWLQAVQFCNALSESEDLTPAYTIVGEDVTWNQDADGYRLPTEAEWEYACRANTTSSLYSGEMTYVASSCFYAGLLEEIGWYCNNSGLHPRRVGQKAPNLWGLQDMSGNVWEWVWDWNRHYDHVSMVLGNFYYAPDDSVTRGSLTVMQAISQFGTGKMARLDQIGLTLHIDNLDITTSQVTFDYADFDSVVNISVNGQPRFIGMLTDLPTDVAPGVTASVTSHSIETDVFGAGYAGTVTLTGDVASLVVGGSQMMLDQINVTDSDTGQFGLDRMMGLELFVRGQIYRPNPGGIPTIVQVPCAVADPIGPSTGATHQLRGGSYFSGPRSCRSAARSSPDLSRYAGFRVVRYTD